VLHGPDRAAVRRRPGRAGLGRRDPRPPRRPLAPARARAGALLHDAALLRRRRAHPRGRQRRLVPLPRRHLLRRLRRRPARRRPRPGRPAHGVPERADRRLPRAGCGGRHHPRRRRRLLLPRRPLPRGLGRRRPDLALRDPRRALLLLTRAGSPDAPAQRAERIFAGLRIWRSGDAPTSGSPKTDGKRQLPPPHRPTRAANPAAMAPTCAACTFQSRSAPRSRLARRSAPRRALARPESLPRRRAGVRSSRSAPVGVVSGAGSAAVAAGASALVPVVAGPGTPSVLAFTSPDFVLASPGLAFALAFASPGLAFAFAFAFASPGLAFAFAFAFASPGLAFASPGFLAGSAAVGSGRAGPSPRGSARAGSARAPRSRITDAARMPESYTRPPASRRPTSFPLRLRQDLGHRRVGLAAVPAEA